MKQNNINKKQSTSYIGYFGNLALSSIGGYIFGGINGSTISTSATIADEVLITNGYTAKHYLTSTALWTSLITPVATHLAELLPQYSTLIYGGGLVLSGGIAYFSNDILNYHTQAEKITDQLFPTVKLFDEHNIISKNELIKIGNAFKNNTFDGTELVLKDTLRLLSSPILVNLAINTAKELISAYLNSEFIKYVGNNGTTMLALTLLQQNPGAGMQELAYSAGKISFAYFVKQMLDIGIGITQDRLNTDFATVLNNKIIETILFDEKNLHKIAQIEDVQNVANNIVQDYKNSFQAGSGLLRGNVSSKSNQLLALSNVLKLAPESIIFTQFFGFLKAKLQEYTSKKTNELNKINEQTSFSCSNIVGNLSTNISKILQTDALEFIKKLYLHHKNNEKSTSDTIKYYNNINESLANALNVLENILNMVFYAHKFTNGHLKLEQLPLLNSWLQEFNVLLQGSSTSIFMAGEERVKKVFEALNSELVDQIMRLENNNGKVIISDYKLQKTEHVILNIKELEFKGNHVCILGASGIGKSTFLKDIKGFMGKPFVSSGKISLPKDSKVMFIDQETFIPAEASLFEGIVMKLESQIEKNKKREIEKLIINLFKELQVYNENTDISEILHDRNFKSHTLSGGQKKKVSVIKAIISKPDILFADEIFTGLDKRNEEKSMKKSSLELVQEALTKHLPSTQIIVVDHDGKLTNEWAKKHNIEHFYDEFIDFAQFEVQSFGENSQIVFDEN